MIAGPSPAFSCRGSANDVPSVLVAEDSVLIALELEQILADCGCAVAGSYGDLGGALQALESRPFDFALIDHRLNDGTSERLAAALREKSIAFAFCTGQSKVDPSFDTGDAPVIWKPYAVEDVMKIVRRLIGANTDCAAVPTSLASLG